MKKTIARAADARGLRELLSVSIQDAAVRDAFVQGRSSSRTGLSTTLPPGARGNPSVRSQSLSQPMTRPYSGGTTSGRAGATVVLNFEAAQLEPLERALSQYIGPLARTLVRREAAKHREWGALLQALAAQIDKPEDRERFLASGIKLAR